MNCINCNQETGATWKTLCRSCWNKRTPDEIRAYRQTKIDKKVSRLKSKAERLQKEADSKLAVMNPYWGDTAFFTQPATPASRFGRQREKIHARYDKGMALSIEADKLKKNAAWLEKQGAVVKGDAERKRQAKREAQDKIISVCSKIYDFCYREGEVIKVNKKTYTIKFTSGFTCTRDKTYVEII